MPGNIPLDPSGLRYATVVGLFFLGCPAAIARFVVPVVVDAIQGMRRAWPWSHVSVEMLRRMQPTLADCNASPAIVSVVLHLGVIATALHANPCPVFGGRAMVGG